MNALYVCSVRSATKKAVEKENVSLMKMGNCEKLQLRPIGAALTPIFSCT